MYLALIAVAAGRGRRTRKAGLGQVLRYAWTSVVLISVGLVFDLGDDQLPRDVPLDDVPAHGNAPRDAGRFDQFAFREASAPPRSPRPEAVLDTMSIGAMRSLIASAGLSSADCVEKSELRARSVLALERLAEAKRLRDSRNE